MRKIVIFLTLALAVGIAAWVGRGFESAKTGIEADKAVVTPPIPAVPINITASFEIYTLGTKRIFTDSKYHNKSTDVFITKEEPSLIHVMRIGVTWNDFFATLPMSLTKDCLITGTGQRFCTNSESELKFFINEVEVPTALDQEIKNGERLKIVYE